MDKTVAIVKNASKAFRMVASVEKTKEGTPPPLPTQQSQPTYRVRTLHLEPTNVSLARSDAGNYQLASTPNAELLKYSVNMRFDGAFA
jgi:hypothetical protein